MNNKIVKIVTALFFIIAVVAVIIFMVQDLKNGLVTSGQKGMFALSVALVLYALWRIFVLVRDIFR